MTRTIGVVTVARSDYGYSLPILRRLIGSQELRPYLIATGSHLSSEFGLTVEQIEKDGWRVDECIPMLLSSDTPESVAKSIGIGIMGFAQSYARCAPDMLLLLGDRFEMLAAAAAALPFKIPIAHVAGGESTEGLIDESIRHSITKMSHLHFTATEFYAKRLLRMGEEQWRVTVSGSPGLDNLNDIELLSCDKLNNLIGMDFSRPVLLATYHPVTLEYEKTSWYIQEFLSALDDSGADILITCPGADTSARTIAIAAREFARMRPNRAKFVDNLGTQVYFSLMAHAASMVGNSSSGIVEAASFKLPVVNVGNRQRGRVHAENVIDTGYSRAEIARGIDKALSVDFRKSLSGLVNPYGDGRSAERIIDKIRETPFDAKLLLKKFNDDPENHRPFSTHFLSMASE